MYHLIFVIDCNFQVAIGGKNSQEQIQGFPYYKMTQFIRNKSEKNDPLSTFRFLIYLSFLMNSFERLLSTLHLSSLYVFTKKYLTIVEHTVLTKSNPMSTQYQVYINDLPIFVLSFNLYNLMSILQVLQTMVLQTCQPMFYMAYEMKKA